MVCIDDETPFEIPLTWSWSRLSNIVQINPKNYVDDDKEAAFIPMEKIEATYLSGYTYTVRKWREIKYGYTHFADGDVAFAKITPCFQNRKSMILNNLPNGIGAGTTELKVLHPYRNTLSVEYLLFFLESPYFVEEAVFKGTANQQRIISGYLENKLFPLPPLNEQRSIAEKIKKSIVAVEQYGKVQDKLEDLNNNLNTLLKKSVLQEAIQGKLVPQDPNDEPASVLLQRIKEEKQRLVKEGKMKKKDIVDSIIYKGDDNKYYEQIGKEVIDITEDIPFMIPDSWVWCRMGAIGIWGAGSTPSKGNPNYYGGNVLWLRTGELNNSVVYDTEIKITQKALEECSLRINKVGDVLIAMYGATIGKVAIVGKEMTTNQACCACTPIGVFNRYLFYFLMASQQYFIKIGEGGAQPNISREKLISYLIPIPPIVEQIRIVETLKTLFNKIKDA